MKHITHRTGSSYSKPHERPFEPYGDEAINNSSGLCLGGKLGEYGATPYQL